MSYKVLIADDEMIILSGIKFMIRWEDNDASVVATAKNGLEAYEKIKELHPDIVITDVKMPLMSGLELLKRTGENFPEIVFVILTSLEEFKLAKEAIRYNATDYLLKTELDDKTLTESLTRAKAECDRRKTFISTQSSRMLTKDSLERTVSALLQMRTIPRESILLLNSGGLLRNYAMIGLYTRFPSGGEEESREEKEARTIELFNWVKEIAEKIIPSYIPAFHSMDPIAEKYHLIAYLASDLDPLSWTRTRKLLDEKIASATLMVTGAETELLATDVYQSYDSLDSCRNSFASMLHSHYLENPDPVFEPLGLEKTFARLEFAIRNSVRDSFSMTMDEIISAIGKKDHTKNQALFVTDGIISALKSGFEETPLSLDGEELIRDAVAEFTFAERRRDITEALENLKQEVLAVLSPASGNQNPVISRAKKYVAENIGKPITLSEVASAAFVSPSYLSALFKKTTGKSLVEYINECKIEKAKEMFDTGSTRVDETALSLGFENIYYFSKVFKKMTGQSPTEYLKRLKS